MGEFLFSLPGGFIEGPPFYLEAERIKRMKHALTTKQLTRIAILSAAAFVLMLFEFPLPIAPSFYKLDLSETAVLIGGFAMGPMAAVIIEALKNVLNILFTGTTTAYVGEMANFIVGCAFAVPAALLYQKNKTRRTAIYGLILGSLCMVLAGAIVNYFILLPMYSTLFHMPMDAIIAAGAAIVPAIHSKFTFVLLATCPFNIVKGILVSLLTFALYKLISPLLH
jgi:riboflavin transporter FmnP